MNFGDYIKEEREKQGLSQGDLAKKAGLTRRTIQYYEQENRQPSFANATKVLNALGFDLKIIEQN